MVAAAAESYPEVGVVIGTGTAEPILLSPIAIERRFEQIPVAAVIPLGFKLLAGIQLGCLSGILDVDAGIAGGAYRLHY